MKNKGFTLVEVLLVIVIIGIIGVITIPNIIESMNASKKEGGKSVEKILIRNLELYNEDRKVDLWDPNGSDINKCIEIPKDDLKSFNQDINMGDCTESTTGHPYAIKRIGKNKYEYYVNITCSKNKSTDPADVYYESNNEPSCEFINPYVNTDTGTQPQPSVGGTYTVTASASTTYSITSCPSGWNCAGAFTKYAYNTTSSSVSSIRLEGQGRCQVSDATTTCRNMSDTKPSYDPITGKYAGISGRYIATNRMSDKTLYWVSSNSQCSDFQTGNNRYLCFVTGCNSYVSGQSVSCDSGSYQDGQYSSSTQYTSATKTVTYNNTYGNVPTLASGSWYTASSGGSAVTGSTTVTTAGNHTIYAH